MLQQRLIYHGHWWSGRGMELAGIDLLWKVLRGNEGGVMKASGAPV